MLNLFQHLVCYFLPSADTSFIPVHRTGFSDAFLIKKASNEFEGVVAQPTLHCIQKRRQPSLTPSSSVPLCMNGSIFNIKKYFCRERFSLYLAVSLLGSKESHAFLVQNILVYVQKLAISNGGDVNHPNNLFAIFKLWSNITEDVLRI